MKYLIFAFVLILGCTSKESTETLSAEDQEIIDLYNETIDIHNEVMPEMDRIMMDRDKLLQVIQNDTLALDSITKANYKSKINKLEEAHEAMFAWMRKYGKMPNDSLGYEEIMKVLNDSKNAIIEVKAMVNEVLE